MRWLQRNNGYDHSRMNFILYYKKIKMVKKSTTKRKRSGRTKKRPCRGLGLKICKRRVGCVAVKKGKGGRKPYCRGKKKKIPLALAEWGKKVREESKGSNETRRQILARLKGKFEWNPELKKYVPK